MRTHGALRGASALGLLLATGCLSIESVDLREGLARLDSPQGMQSRASERGIEVLLVMQEALGGVVVETADPVEARELGSYHCDLFPLDGGVSAESQIERRAEEIGDGAIVGLQIEGVAEALSVLLRRRLEDRFRDVTVRVVTDFEIGEVVVKTRAEAYMEIVPMLDKLSIIRLRADLESGPIFVKGEARRHTNRGHLIWAIPATVVTAATVGVPGLVAVHFGLTSLERDALVDSMLAGMDQAALKLAVELAQQPDRPVPLQLDGVGGPGAP